MKQPSQADQALCERPRRRPLRTFLWTWGIMAMASLLNGGMICLAAGASGLSPWLFSSVYGIAGPLSPLFGVLHLLPADAGVDIPGAVGVGLGVVGFYGLSVAWLFWKPSGWSKAARDVPRQTSRLAARPPLAGSPTSNAALETDSNPNRVCRDKACPPTTLPPGAAGRTIPAIAGRIL